MDPTTISLLTKALERSGDGAIIVIAVLLVLLLKRVREVEKDVSWLIGYIKGGTKQRFTDTE